jgi:hypothetical protein
MIKKLGLWDGYAYKKPAKMNSAVTELKQGQWIKKGTDGTFSIATAGDYRAYMVFSSMTSGRDNITPGGIATYLDGPFEVETDQYETGSSYAAAENPLKIKAGGILDLFDAATDAPELLVAWGEIPVGGYMKVKPAGGGVGVGVGDVGYTGSAGSLGYTGSQGDIGYTGSGA